MALLKLDEHKNIQQAITAAGIGNSLILVRNGIVESIDTLDFGEINIKFHNKEIKQVDTTERKKY